ncbi:MAG: DUF5698 domain-containing protein [Trueperaceae bacterium]
MTPELFLTCLLIFSLKFINISTGTLRIMMLVRGNRLMAGALAFVESLVWVYAAGQVITDLNNPYKILAFTSGFAIGTIFGSTLERWLALGKTLLRIVAPIGSPQVTDALRGRGYFATTINAEGRDGTVRIAFSVIPRKHMRDVERLVAEINPHAFVTFEEVRTLPIANDQLSKARPKPAGVLAPIFGLLGRTR